jgi:hypothetical protein
VRQLGELVNRAYALAEAGLWLEGAARTTAACLRDAIQVGEISVASFPGRIVGSASVEGPPRGLVCTPGYRIYGRVDFGEVYPQMAPVLARSCDLVIHRKTPVHRS